MNGLALCAGVGGLELGLQLALPEYRTVCYVEGEAYAAAILRARMEDKTMDDAPIWSDLRTFGAQAWRGRVDIVSGGYPCQPFSHAGSRKGADDPRHLWPYIGGGHDSILGQLRPELAFFENVGGHLSLGFEEVVSDLESLDYRVAAGLFTAEEVGAPHRRERLFILAHATIPRQLREVQPKDNSKSVSWRGTDDTNEKSQRNLGNSDSEGPQGRRADRQDANERVTWPPSPEVQPEDWPPACPEPAVCRASDGLAHRVDRLRACGNGVVPLVAAHAFRTLTEVLT